MAFAGPVATGCRSASGWAPMLMIYGFVELRSISFGDRETALPLRGEKSGVLAKYIQMLCYY